MRFQFLAKKVDINAAILAQPRFQFFALRVDGNAGFLAKPSFQRFLGNLTHLKKTKKHLIHSIR